MAKRSNGAGSVKRLPSGTWRGQLMDGFHDNGKRRIVSFTAPTKAELLDKIREYKNKKDILGDALTKNTPFSSWADTWYQDYATEVQPSTYANYRYTLVLSAKHTLATTKSRISNRSIYYTIFRAKLQQFRGLFHRYFTVFKPLSYGFYTVNISQIYAFVEL